MTTSRPVNGTARRHPLRRLVTPPLAALAALALLRAAAEQASAVLLVETTSNQVDQVGGYTGMPPGQFRDLVLEVIDLVLNRWADRRRAVAALSVPAAEAARAGDVAARQILRDAAEELVTLVATTHRRLGFERDEVAAVSYSGWRLRRARRPRGVPCRPAARGPRRRPAYAAPPAGAALVAASAAGEPLDAEAIGRLVDATQATGSPA